MQANKVLGDDTDVKNLQSRLSLILGSSCRSGHIRKLAGALVQTRESNPSIPIKTVKNQDPEFNILLS